VRVIEETARVIITTTDPVTGEHLRNLDNKPFVVEGEGRLAIKIYFESEESRRRYLQNHLSTRKKAANHHH